MHWRRWCVIGCAVVPLAAHAADPTVRLELNTLDPAESRCRVTFVIENKGDAIESLKLELVVFNSESIVYRRMLTEMAPIGEQRTMVRTFGVDTACSQIGSILVNEVSACAPGNPGTCLDGLDLSSRVKNVRLYK